MFMYPHPLLSMYPYPTLCCCAGMVISCTPAGPVAEQVLLLENIATSIQTGPNQLPTIHNLLLEAVRAFVYSRCASITTQQQCGITCLQYSTLQYITVRCSAGGCCVTLWGSCCYA